MRRWAFEESAHHVFGCNNRAFLILQFPGYTLLQGLPLPWYMFAWFEATPVFNKLCEIAGKTTRNIILDQTNVYPKDGNFQPFISENLRVSGRNAPDPIQGVMIRDGEGEGY